MKYTIKDLQKDFPNDNVCLEYIFAQKYSKEKGYYRVKGRKCYANMYGEQIHPLAGTIFEKSSTPLTSWFHALFLFSVSKNGVSGKELERQLGVTYKTAWRMAKQIRALMKQDKGMLSGIVEIDETYFGKKGTNQTKIKQKQGVMGMVERKGKIRLAQIDNRQTPTLMEKINENVEKGSHLMTDDWRSYKNVTKMGYKNSRVKHSQNQWVKLDAHTNTIEGFWGQFKRSIKGTYHHISVKHLQSYADEFSFRYNLRTSSVPVFETLLKRV